MEKLENSQNPLKLKEKNTLNLKKNPVDLEREVEFLRTQVKRLELELDKRNGHHSTCMETCTSLNSIHDGLLRFVKQNESLRCIYGNERIQKMLGFDLSDIVGRKLTWFFDPDRKTHRKVDLYIDEKKKAVTIETSFKTSFDTAIPVLCSIKRITGDNNSNKEYIVIVVDIRALKSAQEQTKSILHAERISTLGHLAAGIAHEINNPLSFLLLDLERNKSLLESISSSTNTKDINLQQIVQELKELAIASNDGLNRISEVVKAVKTFGKTDYGNDFRNNEKINIEESIEVAIRLINSKIKKAQIKLNKKYQETPAIKANTGRLVQVFLNLLLNSIQAIEHEHGEINVKTFSDNENIVIEIADNGKGISPDNMKRIFEPYFTTKIDGTGLGLGIINNIIHELGGHISVKSNIGLGTTFTILLPINNKKTELPNLVTKKTAVNL